MALIHYSKNRFWVVVKDNDLLLYTPQGELVWGQVAITVHSDVNVIPSATLDCLVNIAKDEEEMKAKIKEMNDNRTNP